MTQPDLASLLALADKTARQAGDLLQSHSERLRHVHSDEANDVKLQADREAEALIRKALAVSNLPIIGEEEGGDPALVEGDQLFWVVDPLDGTYNFLRRQPLTCVSIGLCRGKAAEAGVIYDFTNDVMYSGGKGIPFQRNGVTIQPQWPDKVEQACILTGFPSKGDFSTAGLENFVHRVQAFKKVRMIGTAAIACAWVAEGLGDIYTEEGTNLWDVAAGIALIEAAGGFAIMESIDDPERPFGRNIIISGRQSYIDALKSQT